MIGVRPLAASTVNTYIILELHPSPTVCLLGANDERFFSAVHPIHRQYDSQLVAL
jgi:hypothetical protein